MVCLQSENRTSVWECVCVWGEENICILHLNRSVASLNSMDWTKVFSLFFSRALFRAFHFSLVQSVLFIIIFCKGNHITVLKCKLIRYLRILYRKVWIIHFASRLFFNEISWIFFSLSFLCCSVCVHIVNDIIIGLNCYDIIMYRANNNPLHFIYVFY